MGVADPTDLCGATWTPKDGRVQVMEETDPMGWARGVGNSFVVAHEGGILDPEILTHPSKMTSGCPCSMGEVGSHPFPARC